MRADEDAFTVRAQIRPARVSEEILSGPPRDVAPPGTQRRLLMLEAAVPQEEFRRQVRDWGLALAARLSLLRVSVDFAAPEAMAPERPFPYAAVLGLWPGEGGVPPVDADPPPPGVRCAASLLVDVCESPPELLAELYQSRPLPA